MLVFGLVELHPRAPVLACEERISKPLRAIPESLVVLPGRREEVSQVAVESPAVLADASPAFGPKDVFTAPVHVLEEPRQRVAAEVASAGEISPLRLLLAGLLVA